MRPHRQRRHDGKVAVAKSTQRRCSDGFEFHCDNGEPLRVTFTLGCCDHEATSWEGTQFQEAFTKRRHCKRASVSKNSIQRVNKPSLMVII
ncbi:hypothetical protein P3T17_004656 [Paraburkholderia sp. GAS82]